jgi:hypothetical protein
MLTTMFTKRGMSVRGMRFGMLRVYGGLMSMSRGDVSTWVSLCGLSMHRSLRSVRGRRCSRPLNSRRVSTYGMRCRGMRERRLR